MTNGLLIEKIWDSFITSTNMGVYSGSLLLLSLTGNYYLWKKFDESKKIHKKYEEILTILEPILTKIVDEKKLSKSNVEDVKKVREMIKFKLLK